MASPDFDPYDMLGIAPSAAPDEIRAAYRRLAAACHPDTQPPEKKAWASEQMVRLTAARDLLLNPRQRVRYHREHTDNLQWKVEKNRWRNKEAQAAYGRSQPAPARPPPRRALWRAYMLIVAVLLGLGLYGLPALLDWSQSPAAKNFTPSPLALALQLVAAGLAVFEGFIGVALQALLLAGLLAFLFLGFTRWWKR